MGQAVPTTFTCTEATGGPGLTSCNDSNGGAGDSGALNTSTAGTFTYTVTATSEDGQTGTATLSYTVVAPPTTSTPIPVISGTITDGQTLTTTNGTWGGSAATYAYQWQRCTSSDTTSSCTGGSWASIGASSSSYTLTGSDVGHALRVTVTASNFAGNASETSTVTALIADAVPTNTAVPAISGTMTDGQTLSTTNGTFTGDNLSYTYQWQRCTSSDTTSACTGGSWASIGTSNSYALTGTDVGHVLHMIVTVTNSAGNATGTSAVTATIADMAPANTASSAITNTDGRTLTTTNGTFTGDNLTYSYQWQRCTSSDTTSSCAGGSWASVGTNSTSYSLASADVGHVLRVIVTATNSAGYATGTSAVTSTIANTIPSDTTLPAISGTTTTGNFLSATTGTWNAFPAPSYTYQWQRCTLAGNCTSILTATSSTYLLSFADIGDTIKVTVTATNSMGSTSATSAVTSTVSTGTVYYVSPSGSDSNNGTSPSTPWQTVSKVNGAHFSPGTIVAFRGGQTFSTALTPASGYNGTSTQPITFTSYGPGQANLTGGVSLASVSWLALSDLGISKSGVSAVSSSTSGSGVSNILINNDTVSGGGTAGNGIYSANSSDSNWTVNANVIENIPINGILTNGSGSTITGNLFNNIATSSACSGGNSCFGVYADGPSNVIDSNTMTNVVNADGIALGYQNNTVEDNTISGDKKGILFISNTTTAGTTYILDNTLYTNQK